MMTPATYYRSLLSPWSAIARHARPSGGLAGGDRTGTQTEWYKWIWTRDSQTGGWKVSHNLGEDTLKISNYVPEFCFPGFFGPFVEKLNSKTRPKLKYFWKFCEKNGHISIRNLEINPKFLKNLRK